MISQNSVARMLAGASEVLDADIAPLVDDRFAHMQLRAISELLLNLSERVDWRVDECAAEAADYAELLDVLGRSPGEGRSREALLAQTAEAFSTLDELPADDERIALLEAVLRRQSLARARSLHSTMYKPARARTS